MPLWKREIEEAVITTAQAERLLDEQRAKCGLAKLTPAKPERVKRGEGRVGMAKQSSALESRFLYQWELLKGPPLDREYKAVPGRKYRFDFAYEPAKLLIEIHGGIWSGGRHTRGAGFAADRIKMNLALELGWLVIELTAGDINATRVEELIKLADERRTVYT